MAIKIGHASIDERGKATGGAAGDQTKKEVCTRTYFTASWDAVLRPKSTGVAEKSAKFVEQACANDNVGYDQWGRNTLFEQAKKVNFDCSKITVKCECDCSSLIHVAVMAAGVNITYGSNGFTTRTMVDRLVASGDYEKLTDSKYLTSDKYLKRGDILVNIGSHTVMVLEDGPGDVKKEEKTVTIELLQLSYGSKGEQVKTLQRLLIALGYDLGPDGADGDFGSKTLAAVKKFQEKTFPNNKNEWDGIVGEKTWNALLK
ncbi:MAG: peptidoglycan-binding protein [Lachnospiraceae bacterium]|nr:peptidoglycan-binding protein [Lachnospiraceae bacterium]